MYEGVSRDDVERLACRLNRAPMEQFRIVPVVLQFHRQDGRGVATHGMRVPCTRETTLGLLRSRCDRVVELLDISMAKDIIRAISQGARGTDSVLLAGARHQGGSCRVHSLMDTMCPGKVFPIGGLQWAEDRFANVMEGADSAEDKDVICEVVIARRGRFVSSQTGGYS